MQVLRVDYRSKDAAKRFTDSFRHTGFAVLDNHPIDMNLVNQVFAAWKDFFHDEKLKQQFLFSEKNHDGLIPTSRSEIAKGNHIKDIKEFYHLYRKGRCPEQLREISFKLFDQMEKLAVELLKWCEQYSPEEIKAQYSMPLSQMVVDSPLTLLRILHYPAIKGDEPVGAIRAAAHEDINLITILPAATAPGLQAMTLDGQWVDIACDPGTLAINCGDMLQMASNRYFPSTKHRVINPKGEDARAARMSMPLFLHPRDDVRLSATHTAHEYRMERYYELGLRKKET